MGPTKCCQSCGAALASEARFCGACGHPVAASPVGSNEAPSSGGPPREPPPPWEAQPAPPSGPPPPAPSSHAGPPSGYGRAASVSPAGASHPPPKKKSRAGLVLGIGCLLVAVLVGALAVGGLLWFTLQEGVRTTGGASSERGGVAAMAAQGDVAKGELLYADDFSDPGSGWDDHEGFDASTVYQGGRYHITVNAIDGVAWGNPGMHFTDFVMEVDATQVAGTDDNGFGVLLRYVDIDNFYWFEISGDGYYSFRLMQDDEWIALIDWHETPAIRQGNSTNRITVVCEGDLFAFYVNGRYLDECRDGTFTEGDIGLLAGTIEEAPVHIAFDNVSVWALP